MSLTKMCSPLFCVWSSMLLETQQSLMIWLGQALSVPRVVCSCLIIGKHRWVIRLFILLDRYHRLDHPLKLSTRPTSPGVKLSAVRQLPRHRGGRNY